MISRFGFIYLCSFFAVIELLLFNLTAGAKSFDYVSFAFFCYLCY